MKLFMHWDMEGVSGLFAREQVWFWEPGVRPDVAAEGRRLTADALGEAIARARTAKPLPYQPALPMTVTIRMASVEAADKAAVRPGVRRLDDHTVEGRAERHCEVVRWINGVGLDMPG